MFLSIPHNTTDCFAVNKITLSLSRQETREKTRTNYGWQSIHNTCSHIRRFRSMSSLLAILLPWVNFSIHAIRTSCRPWYPTAQVAASPVATASFCTELFFVQSAVAWQQQVESMFPIAFQSVTPSTPRHSFPLRGPSASFPPSLSIQ